MLTTQYRRIEDKIDDFRERLTAVEFEQQHLKSSIAADVKAEISATLAKAEVNTQQLREGLREELLAEIIANSSKYLPLSSRVS